MLEKNDEFAHTPIETTNWQENYVWHAWDPTTRSGFNLHLGRIFDEGYVDVRAHSIVRGTVTAGSFQDDAPECLAATGLDVDVIVPFERLKVRFSAMGSTGPDENGWFGLRRGDKPFGFDVEMTSRHPAFDSNLVPELQGMIDLPGTGNHYELGASWRGRLWNGDDEVEASGLLVRDHSWGGRVWPWDETFWVPMVFGDAEEFIFNNCQRAGEQWKSVSILIDSDGSVRKADQFWIRLDGQRIPWCFSTADALVAKDGYLERFAIDGDIHLPVGRARSVVGLADMYSSVRSLTRDRAPGFTTIQTFPTREDVLFGMQNPKQKFKNGILAG